MKDVAEQIKVLKVKCNLMIKDAELVLSELHKLESAVRNQIESTSQSNERSQ